jgi:hypothetical protein
MIGDDDNDVGIVSRRVRDLARPGPEYVQRPCAICGELVWIGPVAQRALAACKGKTAAYCLGCAADEHLGPIAVLPGTIEEAQRAARRERGH